MAQLQIEISDELHGQLADLAALGDRPEALLVAEAIEQYLAEQAWQLKEIRLAIAEADAGDFVEDEEVQRIFEKYSG